MKKPVAFLTRIQRKKQSIITSVRESQLPFMAPGLAACMLEAAIFFYSISMLHLLYMQVMMPIRLPFVFVLSTIPEFLAIVMMRCRIAYCLKQASDPILRRRFSRREWRAQNRTGSVTLLMSSALYFFSLGIMGTRLNFLLSLPVIVLCGIAIIFSLMPAPRDVDECLECAEYGERTFLSRFAPGAIRFMERDPFRVTPKV